MSMPEPEAKATRTIALDHERLDDVMAHHLEIGVPDPVPDGRLGPREEVVQHGHLVPEQHQPVDEVRADKPRTARDEDALPLRRREQLHGGEPGQRGVRDRLRLGVVDRFRLVGVQALREARVVRELLGVDVVDLLDGGREDIVRSQVERSQEVDRDFAIEAESLEADGFDFLPVLVERLDL